jgi:hypothetical protein
VRIFALQILAMPIYGREAQPSPVHFFAKPVGILLCRFTDKTIPPASLHIGLNLSPYVFIIDDKVFVFCI